MMATLFEPMPFSGQRPLPAWLQALSPDAESGEAKFTPGLGSSPDASPHAAPDDAQDEAYQRGFAEGHAAALAEMSEHQEHQEKVRLSLTRLEQEQAQLVQQQLAQTVGALCAATLDNTMPDPELLRSRCDQALAMLDAQTGDGVLYAHPDDLAVLEVPENACWTLAADPALARGALRLCTSEGDLLDGPQQWREAIDGALGL
jgi:flagellar assembly protein FliH